MANTNMARDGRVDGERASARLIQGIIGGAIVAPEDFDEWVELCMDATDVGPQADESWFADWDRAIAFAWEAVERYKAATPVAVAS